MRNCLKSLNDFKNKNCDKGIPNFIGVSISDLLYRSLRFRDLYITINSTIVHSGYNDITELFKIMDKSLSNFSNRLKVRLESINSSLIAKEFATKYKEDADKIENLIRTILYREDNDSSQVLLSFPNQEGNCFSCIFEENELKYCPYRFIWLSLDSQENCEFKISRKDFNFPESADLTRGLIRILFRLKEINPSIYSDRDLTRLCISPITTYIRFYESMNPTGNALKEYCVNLIESLTDPSMQISKQGDNKYFLDTLELIKEDLSSPYPRNYIKNLWSLYQIIKTVRDKPIPYSDNDYYLSYKATPKININIKGKMKSLPSSVYEDDPIKDLPWVINFDNMINYKSYYSNDYTPFLKGPNILTTEIYNPGKYKSRGIHYACNAIQDRCSYIHNRLMDIENYLPESCIKNQFKGVQFLIKSTKNWERFKSKDGGPSLYNFDFSNATDVLDQIVTKEVVSLFLGETIGNFFYEISRLEKTFILKSEFLPVDVEIPYQQTFGQPQGLLGSFDAFNLTHYLIMLGVMKNCGLEDIYSNAFFRILGDDSAIYTYVPDDQGRIKDEYIKLAASCNLKVNEDKSNFIFSNSKLASIDFAKISVTNGEIDSPIPFRLLSRFDNKSYKYSTAFWLLEKRIKYGQEFLWSVLENEDNQEFASWLAYLIEMGLTPFKYVPERPKMTPWLMLACTILAYSTIVSSLIEKNTPHKDNSRPQTLSECDNLLTRKNIPNFSSDMERLNPYHKINNIRIKNYSLSQILKKIHLVDVNSAFDLVYDLYTNQMIKGLDQGFLIQLLLAVDGIKDIHDNNSLEEWFLSHALSINQFDKLFGAYQSEAVIIKDISTPKLYSVAFKSSFEIFSELVLTNPAWSSDINCPILSFTNFTIQGLNRPSD